MGKVFGISDLPVSTIMTPFEPIQVPKPQYYERPFKQCSLNEDKYISTKTLKPKTKSFIDMKNGFGKLMKSFSKIKAK